MKKTLVALAVLAASGASFAQVTMTGEFTWGFKANTLDKGTTTSAANSASGFGFDSSNINFGATEDLGGGTKLAMTMGIDGADRSMDGGYVTQPDGTTSGVGGVDANLILTNGGNKLLFGSMRNKDYLSEGVAAAAGAVWLDFDDLIYSKHTNSQRIEYSYNLGAVTLGYQFLQDKVATAEGTGISGAASTVGQPRNLIQVTYTAGALVANAGYGAYNNKTDNSFASKDSIARISASYDLGVAKVGAGYVNNKQSNGNINDTYLAVGVPIGQLDLGLDWGTRKYDSNGTVPAADGTTTAVGVGATYHLSKRTQLIANYVSYDAVVAAATKSTVTKLYIDHSF
jgi:predicted porin